MRATQKTLYAAGRLLERQKKWNQALAWYQRSLKADSQPSGELLFRAGHSAFMSGDDDTARELIGRAIQTPEPKARWYYRYAFLLERGHDYTQAAEFYAVALSLDPSLRAAAERRSACLLHLGSYDDARQQYEALLAGRPDDPKAIAGAIRALSSKGLWWRMIEILESALDSDPKQTEWLRALGTAHFKLRDYESAANCFASLNSLEGSSPRDHFQEGLSWSMAGQGRKRDLAFRKAVQLDKVMNASNFGIGVFFEEAKLWSEAADAFAKAADTSPELGETHRRAANAYAACYQWAAAERQFRLATSYQPMDVELHYGLGIALERQKNLLEAAEAFEFAAKNSTKPQPGWWYRAGYCLAQTGRFMDAAGAYLLAIPEEAAATGAPDEENESTTKTTNIGDYTRETLRSARAVADAPALLSSAKFAEDSGDLELALELALASLGKQNDHSRPLLGYIGRLLCDLGRHAESLAYFQQMQVFPDAHGMNLKSIPNNSGRMQVMKYASWRENLPLQEHHVFYESFHGAKISCNPLEIYRQLHANPEYSHLTHVWAVTPDCVVPHHMRTDPRTIIIRRNSDAYRKYLATAKYLVSNVTFADWFIRRDGQRYLNTWHGTPLKTLGRDIQSGFLEHTNVARNLVQATHIISPNPHTTTVLGERYDVDGIVTAKIAETGYPRIDRTLFQPEARTAALRGKLGLDENKRRQVVLYAPTWRGGLNSRHFDVDKLESDLKHLASLDADIIFQAHHYTEQLIRDRDLPVNIVPDGIDTNDLLPVVDVLITDYSSIAIDFLALRRPLVFYVYDFDQFTRERGLYFERNEFPGHVAESIEAVMDLTQQAIHSGYLETKDSDLEKFVPREDGHATRRTIEFFFNDSEEHLVAGRDLRDKHSILYHHSFIPNGITTSLKNLLKSVDNSDIRQIVTLTLEETVGDNARVRELRELPKGVQLYARSNRLVLQPEQLKVFQSFMRTRAFNTEEEQRIFEASMRLEVERVYGKARVNSAVEFEGYSVLWTAIISQLNVTDSSLVYLHNEMWSESQSRLPHLHGVFASYPAFDSLVSVSPAIAAENRTNLGGRFGISDATFVSCLNQVDVDGVLTRSREPIDGDISEFIEDCPFVLSSIGRLSIEKNHGALISAFALVADGPLSGAKLVIIGDGPLRAKLARQIEELGMSGRVLLAGQRANPYPVLTATDLFVLPSFHEGQPMVLLEAQILRKQILASDIPGNRYVLEDGSQGRLMGTSVDEISAAIAEARSHPITLGRNDMSAYAMQAKNDFLALALSAD